MTDPRPARTALGLAGVIGLFSIISCANQGAPPGGPEDRTGPQVVETFPDTFAVLPAFDDEIRIVFDERISERGVPGTLNGAVIISPESGVVTVRHSSRALRVTMEGGFQPDEVYRVTVLPIVQDLFRNPMAGAFEFIFSTGAEMTPTVLAGSIVDRITGERAEGARVMARVERLAGVDASDGQVVPSHIATTDSSGVYAFRYVPSGQYVITAFMDQNLSGQPDDTEPIGTGRVELNPADTVFLDFSLLVPDTTPAMVRSVAVVDSLTLAAEFDDLLDPDSELAGVSTSLGSDSLRSIEVVTILHERDYIVLRETIEDSVFLADSIFFAEGQQRVALLRSAGDSTAADEIDLELRSPRRRAPSSPRELQARDLPKRVLYLLLADTLATDQPYELSLSGVTNINGLPGGGGTAEVLREGSQPDG